MFEVALSLVQMSSVLNKCLCFTVCVTQVFLKDRTASSKGFVEGFDPRHSDTGFAKVFGQNYGTKRKNTIHFQTIHSTFTLCTSNTPFYAMSSSSQLYFVFLHCHVMLQGMRFVAVVNKYVTKSASVHTW